MAAKDHRAFGKHVLKLCISTNDFCCMFEKVEKTGAYLLYQCPALAIFKRHPLSFCFDSITAGITAGANLRDVNLTESL